MAHPGDVVEAPLLGARATFLETAKQTNGELLRVEVVLPPSFSISEHVHPLQEERHHVVRAGCESGDGEGVDGCCGAGPVVSPVDPSPTLPAPDSELTGISSLGLPAG